MVNCPRTHDLERSRLMRLFGRHLKKELRDLLRPVFLAPLIAGIALTVGILIWVNIEVWYPPLFSPVAVIDNDDSPQTSAVSSWYDVTRLMVQRYFNTKVAWIRDDIAAMGINDVVA